jgi:lipoprotein-releasing system permease protein
MKLESWLVFALLSLVLVIASFNIISSLSMLIIEKKKDIAILKQLGATQANIRFIFLSVGVLMSVIGSSIGLCFGWLICTLQSNFGFIKIASSGSFVIDAYPVKTNAVDGLLVFLLVLIIAIVASWLPVSKISNGNVAFNER